VVWAVAKGSVLNKAILVPAALALSVFLPWAITPLLMLGGLFLCYEGFEKVWHRFAHPVAEQQHREELKAALVTPEADLREVERERIKGAIRTDFVLSAEIIVIALGTVAGASFGIRVAVLVGIATLMTVGVYGLVAGIVKLDDAGLYLAGREGDGAGARLARLSGRGILAFAPWLMKALSVAGTVAMFLVGGGILAHGIPPVHHAFERLAAGLGRFGEAAISLPGNALVGIIAGALAVALVGLVKRLRGSRGAAAAH
jgi:predicted DNA repair protein MutK